MELKIKNRRRSKLQFSLRTILFVPVVMGILYYLLVPWPVEITYHSVIPIGVNPEWYALWGSGGPDGLPPTEYTYGHNRLLSYWDVNRDGRIDERDELIDGKRVLSKDLDFDGFFDTELWEYTSQHNRWASYFVAKRRVHVEVPKIDSSRRKELDDEP